jgi:hypothetical protein
VVEAPGGRKRRRGKWFRKVEYGSIKVNPTGVAGWLGYGFGARVEAPGKPIFHGFSGCIVTKPNRSAVTPATGA